MDASLYLSKEYNISERIFEGDLHLMKLFIDADTRRKKEEEKLRQEQEANNKFKLK